MMNNIVNHTKIIYVRYFHKSMQYNSQAKIMRKVMGMSNKKKFKYHEGPLLPTPSTFSKGSYEGKRSMDSKRATVLNKLFMRYITDLMSTGECSQEFLGHGLEINRVQITPNFDCVNIYWIAKNKETDDVIEKVLQNNTGSLRHELAQLKIVGVIPKLKFVKDKQYMKTIEVNRLLAQADFGDDYVPVDITSKLKTELELNTNLEPHIIKKVKELDNEYKEQECEESLQPMPHNVFGLNHADIMERLQKLKNKVPINQRLQTNDNTKCPKLTNENPVSFTNVQEEREAFKQFLQKRQILKNKANSIDKNYQPERDYMEEIWLQQHVQNLEEYEFEKDKEEEKDFLDT